MEEQTILDEFNDADPTKKHILIMAHFGRAVYYAQLLEQQCVNMLAIQELCDKVSFTEEDVDECFSKYDFSKKTLGAFSNIIAESYNMNQVDIVELKEVIQMRNHYTHSYFRFNDVLFHSESGKLRMVKDFFRFTIKAKSIDVKLESYAAQYNTMNHVTEEKILSMMQSVKDEWSDKVIDESYDSTKKNN
ncbi:hypothetical protein QG516_25800 [Pedobacter gandavensis]|uniref:hypothetical protein n=1 Tax=Pedobacter gandavensis TaxID=2679963 RepID=UPI00247AD37B|nr:hypothetical protein [Pedobacter gandavensis]WGQ09931.1 hypothetical protein QG516_25800 [Pedobacter gandavensis]